jgi:hypothetical protein
MPVSLHAERPNEPKATVGIGKDPDDMARSANLLVEAPQHVVDFMCLRWAGGRWK